MSRVALFALILLLLYGSPVAAQDTTAPTAPREVNCRAITSSSVECFWFPSRDNVGVTYRIYRAQVLTWLGGLPLTWTTQTFIGTSTIDGIDQRAFLDTGLTAATDYTYWVSAVDPAGNESTRVNTGHANPTTPNSGTTISTAVTYPASVAPSANITVTQTITCSPACTIGHHDVHWGTTMNSLPNQPLLSPGTSTPATTHVNSVSFTSVLGNVYFMEDGHLGGTGYPANGGGNQPHKEGMLFRVLVTNGSALTISPTTLANATRGQSYSQTLTASGEGNGINSWGVSEGRLPDGLTISSAGVVSGTPTSSAASSSILTIMVEDTSGVTSFRTYTLLVGFFVDRAHPSASDANPGTEALPWLTLGKVTVTTFVPGDTIYVKAGTYTPTGGSFTTAAVRINQDGTASQRITLRNFPGVTPVVDGLNAPEGFYLGCPQDYCTIRGFRLINVNDHGIIAGGGTGLPRNVGVIIERNECSGITASTTINPECYKALWTDGAIFRDNLAANTGITNTGDNVCGFANEQGINLVVENNEVMDFYCAMFDKYGGNGNTYQNNYIHNISGHGYNVTCFGGGCSTYTFRRNVGAFITGGCIRFSASSTSTEASGSVGDHNTCHAITEAGVRTDNSTTPSVLKNNYMQVSSGGQGNVIFGNLGMTNWNAYNVTRQLWVDEVPATNYTSFSAWQATGRDANGLMITGTPFTGTPTATGRDPTVYQPSAGGGLQNVGENGTHIGAYETGATVIGIRAEDEVPPPPGSPPATPSGFRITRIN